MEHFMVSIGKFDATGLGPEEIDKVERALRGVAFAEAFPGTYVVSVADHDEYSELTLRLRDLGTASGFGVLISPVHSHGALYAGSLRTGKWAEINRRSGMLGRATVSVDE